MNVIIRVHDYPTSFSRHIETHLCRSCDDLGYEKRASSPWISSDLSQIKHRELLHKECELRGYED